MRNTTYLRRLPIEVRETVAVLLQNHSAEQPVSIAQVVHVLGEHHHGIQISEAALKSCIAAAALERGFVVAFDGT